MDLLFFSPAQDETHRILDGLLRNIIHRERLLTCSSIEQLRRAMIHGSYDLLAGVFFPRTQLDLSDLLKMREHFRDLPIVLILPDSSADTIARGHGLRPRFLTYADADFHELMAVVTRILVRRATQYPSTECAGR